MGKPPPLPLEEAQARLLGLVSPLGVESVSVEAAYGRYLAEPLLALRTQPAANLSAMDGFAVRLDDLSGPWTVAGESAAGHPFDRAVEPGQAIRIATGAMMPDDCDCVILQEDVAREGDEVRLTGDLPSPPSKHIRRLGMDFASGETVLPAGICIGPAQVALAISAGHTGLMVRKAARVAIIDSGDELLTDLANCEAHQIPASNGAMLLGMVRALPCNARRIGPVADQLHALCDAFDQASDCDVIVTSGGASVGDHDLIRPALESIGASIDFWRVAMKPGKPLLVATRTVSGRRQVIVGLPGNPVSSHVTGYLFVLPLIRALLGAKAPLPRRIRTRLGAEVRANGTRREFVRGYWDGEIVVPQSNQDSSALASLAASNVLIDRPANASVGSPGEDAFVYLLQNGGIT